MTANYKLDAMLELRKFLWEELKSAGLFVDTDYYSDNVGLEIVPIIPVQQAAELNQFLSGKTHIVYDKIGMSYEDLGLYAVNRSYLQFIQQTYQR